MSYIGATGYTQYEERFQDIEGNISNISNDLYVGNYSITSNLNRVIRTSSNIFSNLYIGDDCITSNIIKLQTREGITYDDLYVGDNSFASNIQYLKNEVQNETQSVPTKTAIYRIKDLETRFELINNGYSGGNLIDAETGALIGNSISNAFSSIGANITNIGNTAAIWYFLGQCAIAAQVGQTRAATANTKADKSLGIWDESGDNTYNKKTGNVGIGTTFGSTLTNKLEVNGNINIPTGSTFRINNEPFNYTHLAGTPPVSSKWTDATDTTTNIYYNTGNVGIGITSAINNKLEVNGNLNISAGSKYKINNVDLAFSDLGGTLSYDSLSNKLTAGTNINIIDNVINNTYELPKATTNAIGGVRPDGTTITINTSTGVISSAGGTPQVNSDWTQTNTSSKSFIQNKPTAGTNISFANNTITNIITGSPTQNIIDLNNNYLIVKDKPDSQIVSQVDVPLTSGNEPVSTPSVVPTTEGNPITHKTLNFAYVAPPLIYDFTNYNTEASWKAYAATIPNFTYFFNFWFNYQSYNNSIFAAGDAIGFIQMTLPSGYNHISVFYGQGQEQTNSYVRLLINGVEKQILYNANNTTTYSQLYIAGDILRIEEGISMMTSDIVITLTNTNSTTNTYTLSVQSGTSIQVNNGTAQYLSGNYTISVGATQSSVLGQSGQTNPYPLQNGSTIAIRYSMLQRITSTINIKKDGLIKYVPASGTNPSTGSWNIIDLDTQLLTQFSGNLPISRIDGNVSGKLPLSLTDGNLPAIRLDNIDMSKVSTGNLAWSRISSQPALSSLSGNLDWSRIDSKPALSSLSGSLLWNRIDQGSFYMPVDRWIQDTNAYDRFYLAGNSTTFIRGFSATIVEFRDGNNNTRSIFNSNGQIACHFQTVSPTNTDHLGVGANTGDGGFGYYYIHVLYNTFTGFHRCYYEDDEIFNNDMSNEEIDIFKNNYKGRIVISTGKIKTDLSRTIPNEETEDDGNRPSNYEEIKNESANVEWYSTIDKDGIMIEDAIPIVQLSKVRKDKRVYGVLGSADRKTNNKNRLIVNSVGEGAICVCNTNGNIENGDYIQSSELLGFGEKQDDDILHNYSVAKAVMDCNFDLDSPYYQCYELEGGSVRVAFIACTYHCG